MDKTILKCSTSENIDKQLIILHFQVHVWSILLIEKVIILIVNLDKKLFKHSTFRKNIQCIS